MLGTCAMYLDIGRDDAIIMMPENLATMITMSHMMMKNVVIFVNFFQSYRDFSLSL